MSKECNKEIREIKDDSILIALILYHDFKKDGIEFFTPNEFSQQLAYMNRPAGYKIPPHLHNKLPREVAYTQEVLFIKSGKVKIDFYTRNRKYLESAILKAGDVILLASGGHGFTMLEPTEMIEVKQGPYGEENDKTRFEGITE
ncbi:MAG: hypothetical protein QME81_05865 [bacterium]|nr:hypothetical protein [bacterium]